MTHVKLKITKILFVLLLTGLLAPGVGAAESSDEKLTIDSPVGTLVDNPKSLAIIDKHIPGMSASPQLGMARGISLKDLAPLSGGLVTEEMVNAVDADLQKLN